MYQEDSGDEGRGIFWSGSFIEGLLVLLALGLAYLGLYDHQQPLSQIQWDDLASGFLLGALATLPLLSILVFFHFAPFDWVESFRQLAREKIYPLFSRLTIFELAIISILAGLGEELLFRWSIQGGITTILEPTAGAVAAVIIGLIVASILFALCHAISAPYIILTLIVGLYLGWLMVVTTNWIVPAVAHALYDFIALFYLVRWGRSQSGPVEEIKRQS